MENIKEKGFIYIATGKKYIDESSTSIKYLKRNHPDIPICLFTDDLKYAKEKCNIDNIIVIDNPYFTYKDKMVMKYTPFEKSIFLDTDTICLNPIYELFDMLDNFEMLIHSNAEGYNYNLANKYINDSFPEFNTGVIAYRKSKLNEKKFFENWSKLYDEFLTQHTNDQVSFRVLMASGTINYCWIPSAYNFFTYFPSYTTIKVKIIHGRPLEKVLSLGAKINETQKLTRAWQRTYYPDLDVVIYDKMLNIDLLITIKKMFTIYLKNILRKIKYIYSKKS